MDAVSTQASRPRGKLLGFPGIKPVISHDELREKVVFYSGPALHGFKLHRGFNLDSAVLKIGEPYIFAVCGCDMKLQDPSKRLPLERVEELCRRCYGGTIHEALTGFIKMDPVRRMFDLLEQRKSQRWGEDKFVRESGKLLREFEEAERAIYTNLPPLTDTQIDKWLDKNEVPDHMVS